MRSKKDVTKFEVQPCSIESTIIAGASEGKIKAREVALVSPAKAVNFYQLRPEVGIPQHQKVLNGVQLKFQHHNSDFYVVNP